MLLLNFDNNNQLFLINQRTALNTQQTIQKIQWFDSSRASLPRSSERGMKSLFLSSLGLPAPRGLSRTPVGYPHCKLTR